MSDERAMTRADFDHLEAVTTRWSDNDMYGHLNNAVYYELFDSAINSWIIEATGVGATATPELGVVAESGCRFYRELGYPGRLIVGVRVERIGRSSITYRLALFDGADATDATDATDETAAAVGHWVHVYIDATSRATVPIPSAVRDLHEAAVARRPTPTDPAS